LILGRAFVARSYFEGLAVNGSIAPCMLILPPRGETPMELKDLIAELPIEKQLEIANRAGIEVSKMLGEEAGIMDPKLGYDPAYHWDVAKGFVYLLIKGEIRGEERAARQKVEKPTA
jgi:hypothetical protein